MKTRNKTQKHVQHNTHTLADVQNDSEMCVGGVEFFANVVEQHNAQHVPTSIAASSRVLIRTSSVNNRIPPPANAPQIRNGRPLMRGAAETGRQENK